MTDRQVSPLALVGPTASGKSGLSLEIARHWPVEIISVDSALVYRGMDIGTAKPTPAERAQVPHHLIDIRDPAQTYSAAEFAADATRLIADIQARGKHPLLVGGTLLYLRALLQPLDDMPPAQPELRAQLEAEAGVQGWPAMHDQLARVDPTTAARLSPNDSQRIGRALEVWRATGRPLSSFHAGGDKTKGMTMPVISLEPTDRAWLHRRIAQRFEAMLDQGLVAEVQALMTRPDLQPDLPSMRCVGYRQVWESLAGPSEPTRPGANGEAATLAGSGHAGPAVNVTKIKEHPSQYSQATSPEIIHEIAEKGIAATRQLAKRQLTWLRGMSEREALACDAPDVTTRLLAMVRNHWG